MKKIIALSMLLVAVALQGCIVKSIHPFYKGADVIFKKEFISTWVEDDGDKWKVNSFDDPTGSAKNAYEMHWLGKGDQDVVFIAHLFQLEGSLYLDVLPVSDGKSDTGGETLFNLHLLPTHSIAKVNKFSEDEVQIKWFNEDWLRTLFEQNRIRISHETIVDDKDSKLYVLTAGTEELQRFIIKYGNEDQAFDNSDTVWLKLKRVG
jgi:hypothetical protein